MAGKKPRRRRVEDSDWVERAVLPRIAPRPGRPFVIGIGGASGVGKSTTADALVHHLEAAGLTTRLLSLDEFIRMPEDRADLDEWGPGHVRTEDIDAVATAIASGVTRVPYLSYTRRPRKAVRPVVLDLEGATVCVIEGLWALSRDPACGAAGRCIDFGIYLDAPEPLRKRWRFEQEAAKPEGRGLESMERHWAEGIVPDTHDRVAPTRAHADLVLVFDEERRFRIVDATDPGTLAR